jgi:LmbE family N-acetylglucosaminyl deacetylase
MYEYIQPFVNYSIPNEESVWGNKILVIAPHQDDEAIGCGGTLIKNVKAGKHMEIVFCTHDTTKRMQEAQKAALIIGSKKNHFMQFPIRSLSRNKDFYNSLALVINKVEPDVVFMPFLFDKHDDHRVITQAIIDIKEDINLNFIIYSYAVWSPLNPNCLFDISAQWELKKQAIECYKTQIATRDYIKIAKGLNQYWGELKEHGMNYAETFFKASAKEYISLGKKILK